MDAKMAIIDKRRPKANVMEVMNIIGDVKGKNCLMVDDMIDTAGTIVQGAKALKEAGAKEIYACCSHGVLSGPAIERLGASPITELAILDTINIPEEKLLPIFKIISTSTIFANAIENVYLDRPMSKIYD
ncbi:MAG: ribose-phosphate diphosphokinase, partial [Clostridia bacterium]|nr:ribose-phosphate diphosphokinase [Clostridia bacterium]